MLNAKFHEKEAEIVADAGAAWCSYDRNEHGRPWYGYQAWMMMARAAGGLKIIGTERHESRRIDNQLRGRSGRQGDPGESQFLYFPGR